MKPVLCLLSFFLIKRNFCAFVAAAVGIRTTRNEVIWMTGQHWELIFGDEMIEFRVLDVVVGIRANFNFW